MTKWKLPPVIKIYEALGAIADERVFFDGDNAEVYSSEGNKKYDVVYSGTDNAIMSNDNGSYWVGYLGYPSITYLMLRGVLDFNLDYAKALKGIEWKKINTANKNDFEKTQKEVDGILESKAIDLDHFYLYLAGVNNQMMEMNLEMLGNRVKPPKEGANK